MVTKRNNLGEHLSSIRMILRMADLERNVFEDVWVCSNNIFPLLGLNPPVVFQESK